MAFPSIKVMKVFSFVPLWQEDSFPVFLGLFCFDLVLGASNLRNHKKNLIPTFIEIRVIKERINEKLKTFITDNRLLDKQCFLLKS